MSKQRIRKPTDLDFEPVPVRPRSDGWTPDKQVGFVQALCATGCFETAARHVGMTARSARDLRTRRDAASFRAACDAAVAAGTSALTEAAMDRALNGVVVPIFYKGEQVGEKRVFNEALTMFMMRYHDQYRYGRWRDMMAVTQAHPDGTTMLFHEAVRRLAADLVADATGQARSKVEPLRSERIGVDPEAEERDAAAKAHLEEARRQAEWRDFERKLAAERAGWEQQARAEMGRQPPADPL